MNWLDEIRECFESNSVFYTRHARLEMRFEESGRIFDHEVHEAVCKGEIIEKYPEDKPYPSILILGRTLADRPLHIVCAFDGEGNQAIVITAYQPNPERWDELRRRR